MNLRTSILTAIGAAAVLAGTATVVAQQSSNPEATQKLAKALAGRTAGQPVNCINERSKMQVVDDGTILFRDRGIVYVQRPHGGCHGLSNRHVADPRRFRYDPHLLRRHQPDRRRPHRLWHRRLHLQRVRAVSKSGVSCGA